ncbi:hypothetical protein ACFYPC_15230 [Streptomyces sp. NPDC005808]|uniref:hypothetical protein n=1 Tax=Streptomyces sp. NPDC005808 TaxID=3364734 RepID=UPI0036C0D8F7
MTVLAAVLALLVLPLAGVPAAGAETPSVKLSKSQAGTGGSVTVTGTGWRPKTLLMMLICGRSVPSRGVIGGTDSCANADGRAVTTDTKGDFSKELPVAEPPEPCPCVVHVATVTGEKAAADAVFMVAGHSVEPLPEEESGARLSVLTDIRLDGSSGLLTSFGAPPSRTLVFTVGNVGTAAVKDPVFQVGTSHGVFAPQWEEQQWQGTIAPGKRAQIKLPVELAAGAHGDYTVSLKYGGKMLAEQPWGVGPPWGVTLFWILLGVVVPVAVFRVGMAAVDRLRPRGSAGRGARRRSLRLPGLALRMPRLSVPPAPESRTTKTKTPLTPPTPTTTTPPTAPPTSTRPLPWFTPDSEPGIPSGRSALRTPRERSDDPTGRAS